MHPARLMLGVTIGVAAAIGIGSSSSSLGSARPAIARGSAAGRVAQSGSRGALVAARVSTHSASAVAPISTQPHIMMIVEENQSSSNIIGNTTDAPYLNSLANTYARASQWYAVQHNSPHDYLDLLVGSDLGLPAGVPYSNSTLVDELHTAGIPWKAYMESMPSNCYTGGTTSDGLYDPIHNPFHYFKNYTNSSGWCSSGNQSTEGIVQYSSSNLLSALNGSNAPDYVYIVPNNCDNMHGDTSTTSPCLNDSKSQLRKAGDSWVSTNLAPVLNSNWFKQDGIVIITWDEGTDSTSCCGLGTGSGGHIATIVVAAGNQGQGIYSKAGDHYGTLRATEEAFGVTPLLGGSANTINGDLTTAFGPPPGVIAGTVFDTENPAQPISGATVSFTGAHGNGSTTTDSSGSYTLAGITAGSYTVSATDTGFTTPPTQNLIVTSNATSPANFTMTANSGISGILANSDGSPLANVTVTYTGISGSTGSGSQTTSTSPYGFTGVPPGTYHVSASEPGFTSPPTQTVTVTANGNATANFTMAALGSISGTVTNGTTGIVGATVKYTGPNGSGQTNTSDSAGDYQLTGVADGTYSVTASAGTYQPETFTVSVTGTATTTQSFVLASGTNGSIAGTVTDAQTSQPISGVAVKAGTYSATTDASGNYVIENVSAGSYSMTFTATDYVTGSASSVAVTTSSNTEQNAALTETGTIKGNVSDASTHANIVGATVSCASCPVTSVLTDGSGNYSFTQVAPGGSPYTVSVSATGYTGQTSGPLTVNPGGTTTKNFQLSALASISVHETFGGFNSGASPGTSVTVMPAAATGSGDLLVATIKLRASTGTVKVTAVTDAVGNVWKPVTAVAEANGTNDGEVWYVSGSTSVSSTQGITVTTSAAAAISFTVLDVAGASTLDQAAKNFGTAAPPQPSVGPTGTTTHASEIVIADIGWNSTPTLSLQTTGYAVQPVQQSTVTSLKTAEQAAWLILSAPGTPSYGATMSATAAWTAALVTFS